MSEGATTPLMNEIRIASGSGSIRVIAEERTDIDAGSSGLVKLDDGVANVVGRRNSSNLTVRCPEGADVVIGSRSGSIELAGRFGAVSAVVALALYGVLQGVDGVALKQAVDAWAKAPEAEKAARFASAETIRWLEWAIRSYQSFMLGLALILFATMIVWTARAPRPIGYLMGLSGLAYFVQGWVLGSEGFSPANQAPTVLAVILVLAWSIWFVVISWKEPVETRPTRASGRP